MEYIYIYIYIAGMEPNPLTLRPSVVLLYQPWMIYGDDFGAINGVNEWQDKPKYSEETCPGIEPWPPLWEDSY
jgi:hypothetical protein